jgi:hypothetical protein
MAEVRTGNPSDVPPPPLADDIGSMIDAGHRAARLASRGPVARTPR